VNKSEIVQIIQGDITKLDIDVIVNAANSSLLGGGGVDGAIHRAAGPELIEECKKLGGCKTGMSKITKGYNLPARYVIHTVGPVWTDGTKDEKELLSSCYWNSLRIAQENALKTIAFPCISTGAYRFPMRLACQIAINTVSDFLKTKNDFEKIIFVCFLQKDFSVFSDLMHAD
jgi:O-acetyl-ADP-ribose deacetylase